VLLPLCQAASILDSEQYITTTYAGGFPVGYQDGSKSYIFNHVNIIVEYHPLDVSVLVLVLHVFLIRTRSVDLKFSFRSAFACTRDVLDDDPHSKKRPQAPPDWTLLAPVPFTPFFPSSSSSQDGSRVVGFYVEPFTVKHKFANGQIWDGEDIRTAPPLTTCDKSGPMVFESIGEKQEVKPGRVLFTYDVMWRASNVKWASRWDIYLTMDNAVPDKV